MQVFKFGGASIQNVERIKSSAQIIGSQAPKKTLVVISAMGKMTNALEAVVNRFFEGDAAEAIALFEKIKATHLNTLKFLSNLHWQQAEIRLKDFFTEVEWLLHDKPVRNYDYYYDQIVCCGEMLSSTLVYFYLLEQQHQVAWLDVRDLIRTDNNFRDAGINWEETEKNINRILLPTFDTADIIITQGFVGSTDENESTSLGREGSDFSAAIFANILNARELSIWKDVDAVMNADPRSFDDTIPLPQLSYTEVIEMAYYGAQVIHPKTIKPLQNKNISLRVKSFLNPQLPGTVINNEVSKNLPPIKVIKENQVLIQFKSKDFSFVEDKPVDALHEWMNELKMKPNLSQNTAISLLCCLDDHPEKIDLLAASASTIFDVILERNLQLLTIRHYDDESIEKLTKNKMIVLQQKTPETIQVLMRLV